MKKLIVILMLFPMFCVGQTANGIISSHENGRYLVGVKNNCIVWSDIKSDSNYVKLTQNKLTKQDSIWIEKGKQELQEMITLAKGTTLNATTETITFITDKTIKEYIDWCYKDSTYVEYWKEADYSKYQTRMDNGMILQQDIFISPTLVKEYKHKEPTFIGFYEWLKDKKKWTNIN